jgi:alanine racemase
MRATKAIIHLGRLRQNIRSIRSRIGPDTAICIPVKADAYGHGAVRVAVAAIRSGATYLAVASVQEGVELRESGIVAPILLFSLPLREELPEIVAHRIAPLIPDLDFARAAAEAAEAAGETLPVHIKIDTGMGRIGCRPEEALELAEGIRGLKALRHEGTATHLSAADSSEPDDMAYTKKQLGLFREALDSLRNAGIDPGITHAANSGAVVLHEDSYFDMVRPGLLVYGYPPVEDMADTVPVQPVMEVNTNIVYLKRVRAGESISYGRSWTASRDTLVATLPVGYADGLPRRLSGRIPVLIAGRRYPIIGRICMDQCMVDLGPESRILRWEEATIFGGDPRGSSAADLAREAGTIPYEITCGINKRVPRVYVD